MISLLLQKSALQDEVVKLLAEIQALQRAMESAEAQLKEKENIAKRAVADLQSRDKEREDMVPCIASAIIFAYLTCENAN